MKILVTGATGFVGRYTVAAAVDAGHAVRALIRPAGSATALGRYAEHCAVEQLRADLCARDGLEEVVADVDAVIHLAAAEEGDFATQFAGTVVATENLLSAMERTGIGSLVGVSSFAVYDYLALRSGELVTEDSPIDETAERRDEYAQTKLLQEKLYRRFRLPDRAAAPGRVVIVRPGLVYGRNNLWHALLGTEIGPRFVKIGSRATLPITYVENCAEAFVAAAEALSVAANTVCGQVVNVVDDDLPTQRDYATVVEAVIDAPPSVSVPWPVVRVLADLLDRGNELLLHGGAELPRILVPDRLHARFKPLTYTNARAKQLLGWKPSFDFAAAIARSTGRDRRLAHEQIRG